MSNNNNINRYLSIEKINQNVSSLEVLLNQIKNHHEDKSSNYESSKLEKLFHKVLHLKSLVEKNNRSANHSHLLKKYKHKNLVSIMRKFKTKSLLYHLEALIIEDLYKSMQKKKPKRSNSLNSSIDTICNPITKPNYKSETQLNLVTKKYNDLMNDTLDKIVKYQLDYCINDAVIRVSSKVKLKTTNKIAIKHFTTFLLTNSESENDISKKPISQLPYKSNNESVNFGSIHRPIPSKTPIPDVTLKVPIKSVQYEIDDATQSFDLKALTDTIDCDYSVTNSVDDTILHEDDYQISGKHKRIVSSIQESVKYFHEKSNVVLHFFMSESEICIPINNLKYDSNYTVKCTNCGSYFSESLNIKEIKGRQFSGPMMKVKKNRVVFQNIFIPISFSRYFKYTINKTKETSCKKDTRITHIETFCKCLITLQEPGVTENSPNKTDKRHFNDLITINVLYNIVKGNELGCINMLRRLDPSVSSQIKITKEIRLTVHGKIEEDLVKR